MNSGRHSLRVAWAALTLAWQSGPLVIVTYALVSLAVSIVPVGVAWLLKLTLDGVAARTAWESLLGLAAGLALAGVAAALVPRIDGFLRGELTRRIDLTGMSRLYQAVNRFVGLRRFEDPQFYDRLRLAQDSGRDASGALLHSLVGVAQGAVTGAGFVASLLFLSPVMAAAVLLTAVPAVLAERRLARRRAEMIWQVSPTARRELFYSLLLGEVRAAKEVRLFGIGGFLHGRMLAERGTANAAHRQMDLREASVQGALAALLSVVAGAGLVWAIHAAQSGRLSVGDVAMFVAAVASSQQAVSQLVSEYAQARESLLMFDHYLAVVHAEPDLPVRPSPASITRLRRGIEFRDVWFRYTDNQPWVLRGVNLTIPYGASVALVGVNGAGKSTLVKLLCRFYDPARGEIRWDGVDLRELDPAELRGRIGAVFQDFMEYDLSAAENIALGDLTALPNRSRLEAAARLSGIHDTLRALPRGYDTLLSRIFFGEAAVTGDAARTDAEPETGVVLSTGQWQRLALARALLRDDVDLLILDEPSSGLDAAAEHRIHTTLRERRAGRTSLLISHRLGAVRDADRIAVLADGRVAELGDHADLMAAGGRYARLFTVQAEGYRDRAVEHHAAGGD